MPLATILGNLGSGKTLFTVIIASDSKLPVVSNFKLNLPNVECLPFELNKFLKAEYSDCIIILDEAYTYLESRISQSELNRIMSYILFQSRKKNVTIYLTAQLFSTIDKRYRELSEFLVIAYRKNLDFADFVYYVYSKTKKRKIVIPFTKAVDFFKYYDTNEVVFERDEKLDFRLKDGKEKSNDIDEIAILVKEHYAKIGIEKITKDMVKLYFTITELPEFLVGSVYTKLSIENKKSKQKKAK